MLYTSNKIRHKYFRRKYIKFKNKNKFIYKIENIYNSGFIIYIKCLFHIKLYFLFLLVFLYFSLKKKRKISNFIPNYKTQSKTKICICTLAKQENLYIREYLEHYKNYGVNKIYLYDNNDIDGEKLEDVIDDYIKNGFVELSNWRGKKGMLLYILNDCYKKYKDNYDWIMFSEIDEFIHLYNNYSKVQSFFDEPKFNNCSIVYLNLVCHTDN